MPKSIQKQAHRQSRPGTILLFLLFICTLYGCQRHQKPQSPVHDLEQIKDSGELTVLTLYGSTSYFMYRGQEMGFQYEASRLFAKSLGVRLKIKTAHSVDDLVHRLLAGEGDLIAYHLPITKRWKDSLAYCGGEVVTHQVIVQRERGKGRTLKDVTELIGKEVYVKPGKHCDRMANLNDELGGGILIRPVTGDSVTTEDLIAQVAQGKIPYTVADNDLAQLNKTYYPNLNIELAVSFDQRSSWAVRKECSKLAAAADQWQKANVTAPAYPPIAKRCFELSKRAAHAPILSLREGKISPYDELFRKYAGEIGWDWRLLAALAYTESNFDPAVTARSGAQGLMQLMPATARAMGVPAGKEQDAEESIKAATKYIGIIERSFSKVDNPEERHLFALAAYNAGIGHIADAMALAGKYGKDKHVWRENVEQFILLKSHEEYYSDPVCKHGYFRGSETYTFVREVTGRFNLYKEKIQE